MENVVGSAILVEHITLVDIDGDVAVSECLKIMCGGSCCRNSDMRQI